MVGVEAPAVRQPRVSHDEDEPETCAMRTHPNNTGAAGAQAKPQPPRRARANAKNGEGIVPPVGKAGFQPKAVGTRPIRMSHVSSTSHHSLASLVHAREEEDFAEDDNEELSPDREQQDASLGTAVADASRPDTRESTETPTPAPNDSDAPRPVPAGPSRFCDGNQIIQTGPREVHASHREAPSSPGGTIRCTVDDCNEPCVSVYCKRYHTCREHIGALRVVRGGAEVRFCQRCSSFQPVADFDGDRHTCRDALRAYNLARREMRKTNKNKRKEAAAAAGDADGVKRGAKGAKKTRTTEPTPSSNNANHAATAFDVDNRAIEMYRATMNALQATRAAPAPGAPPPPAATMTQLDAMRMMASASAGNQAAALTGNGGDGGAQMLRMMQFMNAAWLQWCANNVNAQGP